MVEALLVDIALIFYYSLPYQLLNPNTFPHCYLVTKVHGNDQVKQKGFCLECTKCLCSIIVNNPYFQNSLMILKS